MSTTSSQTAAAHVRDNNGLLARVEKQTLVWIARRLPSWVNSDHLTGLGVAGMVGAGAAFAAGGDNRALLALVPPALAVNWFGDSLDGTLARVRDTQRPRYGYYVDHVLDVAGTACLLAGMALGGHMNATLGAMLLAAYYAVMAEVFLATAARGRFRMSFMGFGPTELRLVLSVGTVALMRDPHILLAGAGRFPLFDVGGAVAIAGLVIAFVASGISNGRALYREEPLRK